MTTLAVELAAGFGVAAVALLLLSSRSVQVVTAALIIAGLLWLLANGEGAAMGPTAGSLARTIARAFAAEPAFTTGILLSLALLALHRRAARARTAEAPEAAAAAAISTAPGGPPPGPIDDPSQPAGGPDKAAALPGSLARPRRWRRLALLSAASVALVLLVVAGYVALLVLWLDVSRASVETRARSVEAVVVPHDVAARPFDAAMEMPLYVTADRIPHFVEEVFVFREDRHFRSHPGFNPFSLVRAALGNLHRVGENPTGGSTITMQLVKNLLLSQERRLDRKLNEILLAAYLETLFSKDEILAMYLNRAYFGENAYGIEIAARSFFGRSVGYEPKIDAFEAAMLANSIQSPSLVNPVARRQVVEARARRQLEAMGMEAAVGRGRGARDWHMRPQPFRDLALRHLVPEELRERSDRLVLGLTIDTEAQLYAQRAATGILEEGRPAGYDSSVVLVLEPDGAVVALATGHRYDGLDVVHEGRVSPGSALKPFMVLCALERGMRPESPVNDNPQDWPAEWPRDWPRNLDGRWLGAMTLEEAFRRSRNPPAVELFARFGPHCFADVLDRVGMHLRDPKNPTAVLGSEHVSLLALAAAYATLANGGRRAAPYAVRYARTRPGTMVYRHREAVRLAPAFAGRPFCDLMTMLRNATGPDGTGRNAAFEHPVWGKTGTSAGHRDALFVGFTRRYVALIWLGRQGPGGIAAGKGVTGSGLPALYFRRLMATLHEGRPPAIPACD